MIFLTFKIILINESIFFFFCLIVLCVLYLIQNCNFYSMCLVKEHYWRSQNSFHNVHLHGYFLYFIFFFFASLFQCITEAMAKMLGPMKMSIKQMYQFGTIFMYYMEKSDMTQVNGSVFFMDFSGLSVSLMTKMMNSETAKVEKLWMVSNESLDFLSNSRLLCCWYKKKWNNRENGINICIIYSVNRA